VMFLGATAWQYKWPDGVIVKMPAAAYELRERWPVAGTNESDAKTQAEADQTASRAKVHQSYPIAKAGAR
jgi:hypothetical protein